MAKFKKLMFLCTAILACTTVALASGCDFFESSESSSSSEVIQGSESGSDGESSTPEVVTYTIKFVDENGTVLQEVEVEEGDTPEYTLTLPTKEATAEISYEFAGWEPAITVASADTTYTAKFTETQRKYTVTFDVDGGSAVEAQMVAYGTSASELTNFSSTKEGYSFAGWTLADGTAIPDDATVTGDITVKAVWTINNYTAKVVRVDGSEETVSFTIEDREEKLAAIALTANDAQYTYAWTSALPNELALNNEQVFTETRTVNKYKVTFIVNGNANEQEIAYGEVPVYSGSTDKASDAQYTYTFNGWDSEIVAVTGEATYTATYTQTTNKYVVKFVHEDGTELQSSEIAYGEVPAYNGETPTKAGDAQYSYDFAGWGEIVAVTGDVTYTASFTATVNKYTVTFDVDGGSAVEAQAVPYGTSAEAIAMFTSSKAGYIFKGWSLADGSEIPAGATVTGDITVKAIWKEIITVEVENEAELLEAIAQGDVNIKLIANIPITTSGTIIETLNLTLDLNGYTLTRNSANAADMHFIKSIGANGVLKNGKIDYSFAPTGATGHVGFLVNNNDGLVENIQLNAELNSYADLNNLVGLFEGGSGTYRNMVVHVINHTTTNYAGIFRATIENLTLENCIFISQNVPLGAMKPEWGVNAKDWTSFKSVTNCVLAESVEAYTAENYDTSSFSSDYWTIDETTKLPKIKALIVSKEVEVDSEAKLLEAIAQGTVNIKLIANIPITTSGVFIDTLNVTLDLNGYTLTRSSTNPADVHVIKTITENGVLKNGKIDFTYRPSAATGHLAYIINQNNGLVENVEVKATLNSGNDWNNLVGLFEGQDGGVGTYRNIVVQVSDEQIQNASGVFRQVNANLTVENCIIVKNSMPFAAFNPSWGMTEQTLSNLKSSTGSVVYNTIEEYTASNYDTSSFSSDYWMIDETTKLPVIKTK